MKRQRILQLTILALVTALLAAGLIKIAVAGTDTQRPSFAAYHHELTLLQNQRTVLAQKLHNQAELLADIEQEVLTGLDAREALVLARLASLTDQLTQAQAHTIKLQSRLQSIRKTRDGDDNYGVGMRLWLNTIEAAASTEQILHEKLAEEKAAASKLYRKRSAVQLLHDEFDFNRDLYAAVCRRIQRLQRRPHAPPSS
ncbi:MAG: hypothetical protein ACYTE5_04230 [Planctomycetota bacterium]|jgi:hypothetical protein